MEYPDPILKILKTPFGSIENFENRKPQSLNLKTDEGKLDNERSGEMKKSKTDSVKNKIEMVPMVDIPPVTEDERVKAD